MLSTSRNTTTFMVQTNARYNGDKATGARGQSIKGQTVCRNIKQGLHALATFTVWAIIKRCLGPIANTTREAIKLTRQAFVNLSKWRNRHPVNDSRPLLPSVLDLRELLRVAEGESRKMEQVLKRSVSLVRRTIVFYFFFKCCNATSGSG